MVFLSVQFFHPKQWPKRSKLATMVSHLFITAKRLTCISGTTFGGNPLATRIAHHVFERLSSVETLTQVGTTSHLFVSHLHQLAQKFPDMIDTIRGRGLILGLQLKALHNKDAATIANSIVGHARQRGLLIITAGEGTIRLVPPLNIPEDVALEGLGILEGAMEEVFKKRV
jgi:acetylornithine aminotransferase